MAGLVLAILLCRGQTCSAVTGRGDRSGRQVTMLNRDNVLYLVIGALVAAVAVLGFELYQAKKEPPGLHINLGEKGLSIESK
jgi:hypothetical protein